MLSEYYYKLWKTSGVALGMLISGQFATLFQTDILHHQLLGGLL